MYTPVKMDSIYQTMATVKHCILLASSRRSDGGEQAKNKLGTGQKVDEGKNRVGKVSPHFFLLCFFLYLLHMI